MGARGTGDSRASLDHLSKALSCEFRLFGGITAEKFEILRELGAEVQTHFFSREKKRVSDPKEKRRGDFVFPPNPLETTQGATAPCESPAKSLYGQTEQVPNQLTVVRLPRNSKEKKGACAFFITKKPDLKRSGFFIICVCPAGQPPKRRSGCCRGCRRGP